MVSTALESIHSIYGELLELSLYGSLELTQLLEENISIVFFTHLLTQTLFVVWNWLLCEMVINWSLLFSSTGGRESCSLSTNLYLIDREVGTQGLGCVVGACYLRR